MRRTLAALLVASFAAPALAGDVIFLTDGRSLGVPKADDPPGAAEFAASALTVVEENTDTIVYRIANGTIRQTLPRAQVRSVVHDPAGVPPDLVAGLALVGKGAFDEGRAKLVAVSRNAAAPIWAQAEAGFRHAESYWTQGNAQGAERALAAFARERVRSKYAIDARRMRARIVADLGRDEEARAEYDQAARIPGATDEEVLAFRFLAAWIDAKGALASSDPARRAAAAKTFDEIRAKAAGKPAAIAQRCEVAAAAIRGSAEPIAALVAASSDPFVLAVGGTVLADAVRTRGTQAKDSVALADALERYLRVVLLYRDAEGAGEFAAAAQFRAGELFLQISPDDAEAKRRARREWEELVRLSPRSEWARRAKVSLGELQ